jgi:release factor glutamine methyltransferase
LTQQVSQWLAPGGLFIVEMGYQQADDVRGLFEHAGYRNIETHTDLAGKPRFTAGHVGI